MTAAPAPPQATTVLLIHPSGQRLHQMQVSLAHGGTRVVTTQSSGPFDDGALTAVSVAFACGKTDDDTVDLVEYIAAAEVPVVAICSPNAAGAMAALAAGAAGVIFDRTTVTPTADGGEPLNAKEADILMAVSDGLTSREMGIRLGISENTVKARLQRIAKKLGTPDRAAMIAVAARRGFVF